MENSNKNGQPAAVVKKKSPRKKQPSIHTLIEGTSSGLKESLKTRMNLSKRLLDDLKPQYVG